MIVRIMTEGQYRLPSAELDRLNELDNEVVAAVAQQDKPAFQQSYWRMLAFVREKGEILPEEELVASDVILPEPDLTLEDAQELFTGEGVIPG